LEKRQPKGQDFHNGREGMELNGSVRNRVFPEFSIIKARGKASSEKGYRRSL